MPSSENRDVVSLIQAADFCLKSTISLATSGLNFINRINFLFDYIITQFNIYFIKLTVQAYLL